MNTALKINRSATRRRKPRGMADGALDGLDEALQDRRLHALPAHLEQRFLDDTAQDSGRALVHAALAAALVSNVTLLAERTLTPDVPVLALSLHLGLVTPLLLIVAALAGGAISPARRELAGVAIPALTALLVVLVFLASEAPSRIYYLDLLAGIAILGNTCLPLSARAALWVTACCLLAMALLARVAHGSAASQAPVALCAVLTLYAAFQRNHNRRRAYLLDLRHRLRTAQADDQARHDPLTGLANRRRLAEVADAIWSQLADLVSPIAVVLFDVDRFKAFNDLYGHQAGDECLRHVAACAAQEVAGDGALAARYGGEEFILLLPRTQTAEALLVAERLRAAVARLRIPHEAGVDIGVVTASFGVAVADSGALRFSELTAAADAALYEAKNRGRNCVEIAKISPSSVAA